MEHPITPLPELVQQWDKEAAIAAMPDQIYIATQAARWGADEELKWCCHEVQNMYSGGSRLHAARRPKPPSLKEQALAVIENSEICHHLSSEHATILRRALDALPDLQD